MWSRLSSGWGWGLWGFFGEGAFKIRCSFNNCMRSVPMNSKRVRYRANSCTGSRFILSQSHISLMLDERKLLLPEFRNQS